MQLNNTNAPLEYILKIHILLKNYNENNEDLLKMIKIDNYDEKKWDKSFDTRLISKVDVNYI